MRSITSMPSRLWRITVSRVSCGIGEPAAAFGRSARSLPAPAGAGAALRRVGRVLRLAGQDAADPLDRSEAGSRAAHRLILPGPRLGGRPKRAPHRAEIMDR
jgi:hypothetical protein